MDIVLPARLESLTALRQMIAALERHYAGRLVSPSPVEIYAWGLAVYEAATNVVRHGYAGGADEVLSLRIEPQDDRVTFILSDRGRTWSGLPPAIAPEDGGYGLRIIRGVMSEVAHHVAPDGRNVLVMTARFPAEARRPHGSEG